MATINNTQILINNGGGLGVADSSSVEITNSDISFNYGETVGNGISVFDSQLKLSNSKINGNQASGEGGGVYLDNSAAIITNTQITNNSSDTYGGGISLVEATLELIDSSIIDNEAEYDGGGIDVFENSTLTVINSTISGNSAMLIGGISSFDADLDGADVSSTISILDSVVTDDVQENVVITTTLVEKPVVEIPVVEEPIEIETTIEETPVVEATVEESTDVEATVEETLEEPIVEVETPVEETTEAESIEPNLDIAEVHRLYQYERGFHFYTTDDNEASVIQQETAAGNLSYNYEGESFGALTSNKDTLTGEVIQGAEEVYRFFNAETGAHLYTMYEAEKEYIETSLDNYSYEGIAYYAFESEQQGIDTIPVYRMLNGDTGTHLFTADSNEIGHIQDNLPNFSLEGDNGVAFYVLEI